MNYLFSYLEGLMSFLSPCVLPMIPVYLVYLSGSETDASEDAASDKSLYLRRFRNTLAFVLGFTVLFAAMGAMAGSLGRFLVSHQELVKRLSGAAMLVIGVVYLDVIKFNWQFLRKNKVQGGVKETKDIGGMASAFLFGLAFAGTWTPCIGAFLGSALILAAQSDTVWQGVTLLMSYALGLGLPFLILALLYERLRSALKLLKKYSMQIKRVSGILLIILGMLYLLRLI